MIPGNAHRQDSGTFWNKDLRNLQGRMMEHEWMGSGYWVHLSGGHLCPGESRSREWRPGNPGTFGLEEGAEGRSHTGEVRDPKGNF